MNWVEKVIKLAPLDSETKIDGKNVHNQVAVEYIINMSVKSH